MKSIMKSAFAIIAVALMIMVAVVPMVGVFTEDSDATTITDPDQASTDKIKLTFNLYDVDAKVTETNYYVKVTWNGGKNSQTIAASTSGSTAKTTFDETKMTGVKVIVGKMVSSTFVQDEDFAEYTVGDLKAGAAMSIDLYKGFKTATITFKDAGTSASVYSTLNAAYPGSTMTVKYTLYSDAAGTKAVSTVSKNVSYLTGETFGAYYPATYSALYIKVTGVEIKTADGAIKTIGFSNATAASINLTAKTATVNADQYVYTINGIDGFPAGKVSDVKGTYTAEGADAVDVTATAIKDTIGASGNNAIFMYTAGGVVSDFKYTLTFGSQTTTGVSGATPDLSSKAYYGTFKMGSISAADNVNLVFTKTVGETNTDLPAAYVNGGYYYVDLKYVADQTASYVVKSSEFGLNSATLSTTAKVDITAKADNSADTTNPYKMVLVSGSVNNVSSGYTFTVNVNGQKTFGLNGNNVVCGTASSYNNAAFSFYVVGNTYIEFAAASDSAFSKTTTTKYFVDSANNLSNITLALEQKTMKFKFTDGDAKAITENVTTAILNAKGTALVENTDYTVSGTTVTFKDGSIDISKLKVYFTASNNTFTAGSAAAAVAYTEGTDKKMAVSSLETTYSLFVKDKDGNLITDATVKYIATNAYVAEDGTKIYDADASTSITVSSDGSYQVRVNKNFVNVTLTGEKQNVLIFTVSKTGAIFNTKPYLATADADKTMTITAKADSLSATIYKTDGVTPIANTEFKLMTASESGTLIDVGVTDVNGKVTFTSDAKIASGATIMPTVATGLGTITKVGTTTDYKAQKNIFTVSITDADGATYAKPTGTFKLGTATGTITNYVITVASDAKAGDILAVELKDSEKAVRTFDNYTLTADDIKSGTISLVSNESTYTVSAVDADGKAIVLNTTDTKVKTKQASAYGNITADANVVYKATPNSLGTKITYVITAPADGVEYVADIVGSDTAYGLTAGVYYAFDEKNAAVAESTMSTITFELVEADGDAIAKVITPNTVKANDVEIQANKISGTNKYWFIGDATSSYNQIKVDSNGSEGYTFTAQYLADGIVKANQQTVVFSAVDASGKTINEGGFTINTIGTNGKVTALDASVSFDINGEYTKVMAVDSTVTYALVDNDYAFGTGYTFTANGTDFIANEETVEFSFYCANGFKYDPTGGITVSSVIVEDKTGVATEISGDNKSILVNTDVYTSYEVKVGSISFYGTSGTVVSDYSLVTGYVPTAVTDATSLTYFVVYYNGSVIVDKEKIATTGTTSPYISTDGIYVISLDFVNGGYDKVAVQCFADNVLYAQAILDAKTGVVADLVPVYSDTTNVLVQIVGNDSSYVASKAAGGKAYLSVTDKISEISDDGKYVEIYKFAGWYVNGVKTSEELTCTVDNVSSNVVFASFVLDDTQELDKESASGISPTVLVIGIAAVIIALIAVVYAVIQKKE